MAGDVEHAEFREIVQLLHTDAELVASASSSPEVVVFFHSRPLSVRQHALHDLRNAAPLAGVIVVAGSSCEGELRTGPRWPGVHRHYWYEFPVWWSRQVALRLAGRCPEWAKPSESVTSVSIRRPRPISDFVVLRTPNSATAETLADQLEVAGYGITLQSPGRRVQPVCRRNCRHRDGGQLNDTEARDLSRFCTDLRADHAPSNRPTRFPTPRFGRSCSQLGAAAVLGKPWLNADLLQTIEQLTARQPLPAAARLTD